MQAGVAQIEITPPIGTALTGFIARSGPATGVHDPLYAKALVVDNGTTQVALLTLDVLGVHRAYVAQVRTAIAAATGIPAGNILLACSHTHAGPATFFLEGCGEMDEAYLAVLHQKLVDVTHAAWQTRVPARFGVGHGQVTTSVHNRRTPGAIIDPDLGILRVESMSGALLAVVLNYTCHPTCVTGVNQLLSAEYCGYAAAQIQRATGAVTLFITGAIGDVGPVTRGWAVWEQIGSAVAAEALRVLPTIAVAEWHHLAVTAGDLLLPLLPPPTTGELAALMAALQEQAADSDYMQQPYQPQIVGAMLAWATKTLAAVTEQRVQMAVTTELQILQIGELALVSAPGELFVELGLAVKQGSGRAHLFICGFGNDNIGYIPTPHAYPHGGYEVDEAYKYYGYPAALAPAAGQHYVATAVAWLQD
ncbi:MAG: neutral/alkaline non-lysosomal ceramidase N-terminal domain-containing protein [Caldilineaceae bacterium]|nr:neutral/alkaline non-lysosomal ceramidase N-terminal domain-containing protein [Caldilineaceae bacterium]